MNRIWNVLKTGDFILFGILCLAIILSYFIIEIVSQKGQMVSISVNGRQIYRLNIIEKRQINVNGKLGETIINIKDGYVWISKAPCSNKLCMKMGKIDHYGEIIVCIPNKIIVKIESVKNQKIDTITM